jgi:hypothetical protein
LEAFTHGPASWLRRSREHHHFVSTAMFSECTVTGFSRICLRSATLKVRMSPRRARVGGGEGQRGCGRSGILPDCHSRPARLSREGKERWPSGRRRSPAKRVYGQKLYRGFESHPLRQKYVLSCCSIRQIRNGRISSPSASPGRYQHAMKRIRVPRRTPSPFDVGRAKRRVDRYASYVRLHGRRGEEVPRSIAEPLAAVALTAGCES